jgi:hypothetical protein
MINVVIVNKHRVTVCLPAGRQGSPCKLILKRMTYEFKTSRTGY